MALFVKNDKFMGKEELLFLKNSFEMIALLAKYN
jgi:hypothetical protein